MLGTTSHAADIGRDRKVVTGEGQQAAAQASAPSTVVIDASKNELFTPASGLKGFVRKLKQRHAVATNSGEITEDLLATASLVVFAGPREPLSASERDALSSYLEKSSGSVLLLGFDASDAAGQRNGPFNEFLERFGMHLNADSVARHVFQRYFHPKQVLIHDPALSGQLAKLAGGGAHDTRVVDLHDLDPSSFNITDGFPIVYPFGCTIDVERPAVPLLQSGSLSFPANRPIGAAVRTSSGGTLVAVGSSQVFADDYVDKENNDALLGAILKLLLERCEVPAPGRDAGVDLGERVACPNTASLADTLHGCLQESDDPPQNFTALFDDRLFDLNVDLIPEAVSLGVALDVPSAPLTLIPPEFEIPQPRLQPAAFPPCFREMPPPPLELFDLDDHFATRKIRLAQACNRCDGADLDWFVREAGDVCGVVPAQQTWTPTQILLRVLADMTEFRKADHAF
ncbi:Intraflagellar transport protein 52 C-terminal domain-containing protein [Plasmodiophora brassicae]